MVAPMPPRQAGVLEKKNPKGPRAINLYMMAPYRKENTESSHDSIEMYNLKGVFIQIKLIHRVAAGQYLSIAGSYLATMVLHLDPRHHLLSNNSPKYCSVLKQTVAFPL